jgi:poly(3-hydroxybutyrate) depolymerase
MLYELHELHHALIEPWHALARTNHELFSHPFSPLSYHPLADRVTASADLMQRLTRRYEKPTFRLNRTVIKGADVAVAERAVLSPHHVLASEFADRVFHEPLRCRHR